MSLHVLIENEGCLETVTEHLRYAKEHDYDRSVKALKKREKELQNELNQSKEKLQSLSQNKVKTELLSQFKKVILKN